MAGDERVERTAGKGGGGVFGSLKVAVAVLIVQALLLVYQYCVYHYSTYPIFIVIDIGLAYGTWRRNRIVIGIALVYIGIDLFLAIMYLISGILLKGVIAFIDFLAIHDIVSYIGRTVREEETEVEMEESGEEAGDGGEGG
ncbi:MAG: hypothetical protein GXO14_02330 [Thermococci archaeon]|nr:hypothetical protein [Thermococci archaeon]